MLFLLACSRPLALRGACSSRGRLATLCEVRSSSIGRLPATHGVLSRVSTDMSGLVYALQLLAPDSRSASSSARLRSINYTWIYLPVLRAVTLPGHT